MSGIGLAMASQHGTGGLSGYYAVAAPATVYGARSGDGTVTTSAATVAVHSGTAPFTYAWTNVSGDASVAASTPTAATTTFTGSVSSGAVATASMKCTVTDSTGGTPLVTTCFVSVRLIGSGVSP